MHTNLLNLKPFFTFYGGKFRAAPRYPAPRYNHVIEPFAGSAGYAVRYAHLRVTIYEVDEKVYGVWNYLQHASEREILSLPIGITHVDEIDGPQEAKWLVGFWFNKGCESPRLSASKWMKSGIRPKSQWGDIIRSRIAGQLQYIRHWTILKRRASDAPDVEATWFVDPPYQQAGKHYRCKIMDYNALGDWCRTRRGQVMVCENAGATWLPFREFATIKASPGKHKASHVSEEVIWTNETTDRFYASQSASSWACARPNT
jgi:hypothetical protein